MASVHRYSPKSVMLPEELPIRRDLRIQVDHSGKPISDHERMTKYDVRTVFYDVFLSKHGPQIVAIGPPLVNLKTHLLPMEILLNGHGVRGRIREFDSFWTCIIDVPETLRGSPLEVSFRFQCFEVQITVCLHPFPDLEIMKALHTVQKDNPIAWIVDWCLWHVRLHSFKCVFIYDNGSKNTKNLVDTLSRLKDTFDVILIDWPFPYYGATRIHVNEFAQFGALNHGRLFFGATIDWIFCLDIDEYLSVNNGLDLDCQLRALGRRGVGVIIFKGWIVPAVEADHAIEYRSIRNYWFREREPDGAKKYAYRPNYTCINEVHTALPCNAFLARMIRIPRLHKRITYLIFRSLSRRWRIASIILRYLCIPGEMVSVPMSMMCFYHYRGLNTNWKLQAEDLVQKFSTERHVKDIRPMQLCDKAGIAESTEKHQLSGCSR